MGQKTSPIGLRLGIRRKHQSNWYIDPRSGSMKKLYPALILEDIFIRNEIKEWYPNIDIGQILISRILNSIKIEIYTTQQRKFFTRGRFNFKRLSTSEQAKKVKEKLEVLEHINPLDEEREYFYEQLKQMGTQDIEKYLQKKKCLLQIFVDILFLKLKKYREELWFFYPGSKKRIVSKEIVRTGTQYDQFDYFPTRRYRKETANLQGRFNLGIIVYQIDQRYHYASILTKFLVTAFERRKSVKRIINNFTKYEIFENMETRYNIQGVKVKISGRIDGVDMAEQINYRRGRIPLSTVSAKIDYCYDIAKTMHGILGIKVWIYIND